ncbi:MAG: hypothetical protein R3E87_13055 [Burkholderiaceae bacterium]
MSTSVAAGAGQVVPDDRTSLDSALRSPRQCERWIAAVLSGSDQSYDRLSALGRLLAAVAGQAADASGRFERLEAVRATVLHEAGRVFAAARLRPLPYGTPLGQALRLTDTVLASLAEAYAATFDALESERAMHRVIPGAADELVQVLPLVRALDAQSRRLAGLMLARVHLDDGQLLRLAELGQAARSSTFLDAVVRDPTAGGQPCTARASFVRPLLLRLAAPFEWTAEEAHGIDWLATRLATRVGFRVDEDAHRRPNPYGPTLRVGLGWRVRLDTHRLLASLAGDDVEWRAELTRTPDAPVLSEAAWTRVLQHLRACWSARWRRTRPLAAGGRRLRLHLGWPARDELDRSQARPYDWGRYDGNRIAGRSEPADQAGDGFMRWADRARWVAMDHDRVWFERGPAQSELVVGGLLQFAPEPGTESQGRAAQRPRRDEAVGRGLPRDESTARPVRHATATGPARHEPAARSVRLGRLLAAEHLLDDGGQRLAIVPIPGNAQVAGLGASGHACLGEAFWIDGGAGDAPSLVVRKGRLTTGERVIVALAEADITVRLIARLTGGADFEHWQVERLGGG